jgi:hypothetical protein
MMQVCRRQVYEGNSKAQMFGQSVKKVARSTNDMVALLFGLMLNHNTDSAAVQSEQQTLLRAIDHMRAIDHNTDVYVLEQR